MLEILMKGGPVIWPLLVVSIVCLTVVIERLWFIFNELASRKPADVEDLFGQLEKKKLEEAIRVGSRSTDFVARAMAYALKHRGNSLSNAFLQAANRELSRFSRGLPVLDTVITLAPLLGLLGTVTGLIHSFGLLGDQELQAPTALTGGIAQALIATAFGLVIAVTALIPFNYLNARLEAARRELEDTGTQMELLLRGEGN
ncbi:MAG TPA: MotA/TolQ/ExbB proton channel family protein [bacterium]|nr:MotA/TolQ/ExbB proton channel family protein [bacterium]